MDGSDFHKIRYCYKHRERIKSEFYRNVIDSLSAKRSDWDITQKQKDILHKIHGILIADDPVLKISQNIEQQFKKALNKNNAQERYKKYREACKKV